MNKVIILGFVLVIAISYCLIGCSKTSNHTPVNITLYNKPLNIIQQNITGNWKLIYTNGGYIPIKQYYDSTYWQFTATRTKQIYPYKSGGVFIDSTINWVRESINSVDSSFILYCYDDRGYNYDYVVMKIYNDTLILHQDGFDGLYYHFIKQ